MSHPERWQRSSKPPPPPPQSSFTRTFEMREEPRAGAHPTSIGTTQRKRAAHRNSLQGKLAHEIVALGDTFILEKLSYRAWQKQYGKSVSERAPGMFVAQLRRTVASTGGTLLEVPTRASKLSQFCHGCGRGGKTH